jgi:hypothetical protein
MNLKLIMMDKRIHTTSATVPFFVILWLIGIFLMPGTAKATTGDSTLLHRPGQITFVYPMGTNGINSPHCVNNFSVNMLFGISGGTNGFETGGLVNIDFGNVKGFQSAGLVNLVTGQNNGFQAAGIVNIVRKNVNALQLGGLANINLLRVNGVQVGGLLNFGGGTLHGASIAGIANVYADSTRGLMAGGIASLNSGELHGAQISGIFNVAGKNVHGGQVSGISNIAAGTMSGVQVGGILNYTRRLNGLQLGFINYADTVAGGVPVGFLSFVRHGYHKVEFESNETLFANVVLKTGTRNLYNIFSAGYRLHNDQPVWGVTYGLGSLIPVTERFSLNIDLTATHINEGKNWTEYLNMLNRLKVNAGYRIAKGIEIFGGISANVSLTRPGNGESVLTEISTFPGITFYENTVNGTLVRIYPGMNAGIRF